MAEDNMQVVGMTTQGSKSKSGKNPVAVIIGILVLVLGVVAGILLVKQNQDVREKAEAIQCPDIEECPNLENQTILVDCTNIPNGGEPRQAICSLKGKIESCGGESYCCPSAGGAWTLDMTICENPSSTQSPLATVDPASESSMDPTSTATATATSTSTASATPRLTATPTNAPIPETGVSIPSVLGIGVGVLIMIASFVLVI